MGRFSGLGDATGRGNTKDIPEGQYLFLVKKIIMVGAKGNHVMPSFRVLEADNVAENDAGRPLLRVGDPASVRWDLVKGEDWMIEANLGRFKMLCSMMDQETLPEEIDEDYGDEVVGPGQPFRGELVRCVAVTKPNTTKPGEYTHLNWAAAEPEDFEAYPEDERARLAKS